MNGANRYRRKAISITSAIVAAAILSLQPRGLVAAAITQATAAAGNSPVSDSGNFSCLAIDVDSGGDAFGSWEGTAQSSATFGGISLATKGTAYGAAALDINAQGSFADELTISGPALAGQIGSVFLLMRIDAEFSIEDIGLRKPAGSLTGVSAQFQAISSLAAVTQSTFSLQTADGQGYSQLAGETPPFYIGLQMSIVFGEPIAISFSLSVQAAGEGATGIQSGATRSSAATATWQGISHVSAHGGQISDFSVSALSGTNYVHVIPEPSSLALSLLAAAMLTLRRRRR